MSASHGARSRCEELGRRTPEWRPWLAHLDRALAEDASGRFDATVVSLAEDRSTEAPLLAGARLTVPSLPTTRWLARSLPRRVPRGQRAEVLSLAIRGDTARLQALAVVEGVDGAALAAASSAATLPVLFAVRRAHEGGLAATPTRGGCPVCGGWPAFAESRGLERARRLRCGRCGADWPHAWLRCVYCGESDHRRQGSLVPEASGESLRVDACASCGGYVKTVATVSAFGPEAVPLEDLATVALDVAAIERGYRRPPSPVVSCSVSVTA